MINISEKSIHLKTCPWAPRLTNEQIENIDYEESIQNYDINNFLRDHLLHALYPNSLLEPQTIYFKQLLLSFRLESKKKEKEPLNRRTCRCQICNYILDDLEYYCCRKCGEYYHEQCLHNKKKHQTGVLGRIKTHQKKEVKHDDWACLNCRGCSYCFSMKNRDSLVI